MNHPIWQPAGIHGADQAMRIDFHAEQNRYAYAGRRADASWMEAICGWLDPVGRRVADIGCGGGIYTKAWAEMGASAVVGVDFSQVMLEAAKETCRDCPNVTLVRGDALRTGMPGESTDVVFARALIHHLDELDGFFAEAARLLVPGGLAIVQDRTMEDVSLPGSPTHLRGYFFSRFPRLLELEKERRPADSDVQDAMRTAGFQAIHRDVLWETRRVYSGWEELEQDLLKRNGRSILHALSDEELRALVAAMKQEIASDGIIVERDRWTIWIGTKQ
ncbi:MULTISPECIES: class I SAM-dependent methyltransferase [Brevibacillus]|jgi:ubiquinone/menaquinone biosynthesis C-methylase UbiE|uniref:SAM-dependent methyltransferase n=1 Tax=Brevibacillus aydinogluensis TaxID=927786 RepID=A0AA48MB31_9BACL|nr:MULTISPECIES: class I SAM-dependent methyltransferase [Bacillales]MDT3415263.1 ubiquinone/menaquinone biosynthesis C-methylase UbiE [Brevibacillus aydinogluensis]CAJ1002958.1 SAM-dependent methyltransferase [Brevibacillus aydinogluensis]